MVLDLAIEKERVNLLNGFNFQILKLIHKFQENYTLDVIKLMEDEEYKKLFGENWNKIYVESLRMYYYKCKKENSSIKDILRCLTNKNQ